MRTPVRGRSTLAALTVLAIVWTCPASGQSEAPIAPSAPEPPPALSQTARLQPGETVTLRVRQVIPSDGLTAGERLLNGRPAIAPGDRVIAEDVRPGVRPPPLIGGTIVHITPAKKFAKPSRITIELGQLVQTSPDRSEMVPWVFDLEDRRFNVQMRRQADARPVRRRGDRDRDEPGRAGGTPEPAYLGLGGGRLDHGDRVRQPDARRDTSLEPGDTFKITVGTLSYRPLSPSPPLSLYPAPDPAKRKKEHGP